MSVTRPRNVSCLCQIDRKFFEIEIQGSGQWFRSFSNYFPPPGVKTVKKQKFEIIF